MKPFSYRQTAWVAAAILLLGGPNTPSATASDSAARYTMQQTDNGMLRLDTRTGAMSLCKSRDGAWACARIEDDSAGLETEVRELKRENRRLRDQVAELQSGKAVPSTRGTNELGDFNEIPSEQDVDRAFTFLEGLIRRFKGLAEDLQETKPNGTPL